MSSALFGSFRIEQHRRGLCDPLPGVQSQSTAKPDSPSGPYTIIEWKVPYSSDDICLVLSITQTYCTPPCTTFAKKAVFYVLRFSPSKLYTYKINKKILGYEVLSSYQLNILYKSLQRCWNDIFCTLNTANYYKLKQLRYDVELIHFPAIPPPQGHHNQF